MGSLPIPTPRLSGVASPEWEIGMTTRSGGIGIIGVIITWW